MLADMIATAIIFTWCEANFLLWWHTPTGA